MTFEELTTIEKLNNAFKECSKISHWKESTQRYKANMLLRNTELQNELRSGEYKIGNTIDFVICERGKRRQIKAPVIKDRIVQKVLCKEILIPALTKPLIYDNYASLKDRGTSFARKRIDIMLRRYIQKCGENGYILQIDIRKFFESIDHQTLREMIHKRIKEPKEIMDLIDYIIDTSSDSDVGLNLGAECPQIFAVYYLSGIDSYVKTVRGMKYYGRYMDDIFIISESKDELKSILEDIKYRLGDIKLEINERKTHITTLKHGFTFMQIKYSVQDGRIIKRPTRSKIARERRRLKKYKKKLEQRQMSLLDIQNCYKSWRNNILKDCNACCRSIHELDKLFERLFLKHESYRKVTREQLIRKAYREANNGKGIFRRRNCYRGDFEHEHF